MRSGLVGVVLLGCAGCISGAREAADTEDPGSFVNWCTFTAHGAA